MILKIGIFPPAARRMRQAALSLLVLAIGSGTLIESKASLIINEVFNGSNTSREWIEFLVTTDITLGALDSIWFGDTNSSTSTIDKKGRFVSSEIISNFSYFNSTSDIVRAGTIIVVGGNDITSDFSYNPDSSDAGNNDIWNFTLSDGIGYTGNRPVNLGSSSDTVWISSAQPSNNTDTSNFISAISYLNSTSATGGGTIADFVSFQAALDPAFQTVHRGSGGGYDGNLSTNRSLSNLGDVDINFASSEGSGSLGNPNGSFNSTYISSLRAVPEPGAFVPLGLLVLGGFFLRWKKRRASLADQTPHL